MNAAFESLRIQAETDRHEMLKGMYTWNISSSMQLYCVVVNITLGTLHSI